MNTDNAVSKESSTPQKTLFLLRHGETTQNAEGRFLGRTDATLNESGVAQAQRGGATLRSLAPDVVISSPALRAVQTAELLQLGPPQVDGNFREIDFGDWEGRTQEEVAATDPEHFAAFISGDIEGFPGGELVDEVAQRTVNAIHAHNASRALVVTHATVIRILVVALLGLPVTRYRSLFDRPGNLSMTELAWNGREWALVEYAKSLVSDDDDESSVKSSQ
jgi:probable phosphoglycerate mutase